VGECVGLIDEEDELGYLEGLACRLTCNPTTSEDLSVFTGLEYTHRHPDPLLSASSLHHNRVPRKGQETPEGSLRFPTRFALTPSIPGRPPRPAEGHSTNHRPLAEFTNDWLADAGHPSYPSPGSLGNTALMS